MQNTGDFFDESRIPSGTSPYGDLGPTPNALMTARGLVKKLKIQARISPKEVNFDEGVQLVYASNGYNLLVHVGVDTAMLFKSNVDPDTYAEEFRLDDEALLFAEICRQVPSR